MLSFCRENAADGERIFFVGGVMAGLVPAIHVFTTR
jgi:hypothetical protein